MSASPTKANGTGFKRSLGVASLFAVARGSVSIPSDNVTLLNGAGSGGEVFLIASCYSSFFL